MIRVAVAPEDFDTGAELARLAGEGVGGVASFIGHVRGDDGLESMTLEHYPAMTLSSLNALAEQAAERWSLSAATIIHRVGELSPGDRIVFVGASAPHRRDALDACAFLIDRLKTSAPFCKSEQFADGRTAWVQPRGDDGEAAARWDEANP